MVKLKFKRDELLILQTDLSRIGEYVECALCRARGWKNELVHEPACLLRDDTIESVVLIGIRRVCTRCSGSGKLLQWTSEVVGCYLCDGNGVTL